MKFLYYKDVFLVPRHSSLPSRSQADTSVDFMGKKFKLPIIPANMLDVINTDIAKFLSDNDYFYIMHRWFNGIDTIGNINGIKNFVKEMYTSGRYVSISIGVGDVWIDLIKELELQYYPIDFICIDVAHADHDNVKNTIKAVKQHLPNTKLIVGNIATPEGCEYLIKLGVDAVKAGVAGGRICVTKNKTGFHVPMFSCCLHCAEVCDKYNIPFIADGGIEEFGDIAKALTAGATMVMAGGIFAECIDSPAEIIHGYKQYRGSTSYEMKGKNVHIEGKKVEIEHSVTYAERLVEIQQALASSISYGGGKDLSCFNHVQYITC
jgi:GMP reductase